MFRSLLFITTNISFILLISTVLYFSISFFLPQYLYYFQDGKMQIMFGIFLVIGFLGSFFTLFSSKWLAKRRMGVYIIKKPITDEEKWLIDNVADISIKAGIGMPEVGVYQGNPNAFATGWNRNNALLVVSTGLYQGMTSDELRGVIAHEIAHISNGDMITMTLLQGLVNTFVLFFSWIASMFTVKLMNRIPFLNLLSPIFGFIIFNLFNVLFGFFGSLITMWFSRHREYKADKLAAELVGPQPIYDALGRLGGVKTDELTGGLNTMGFLNKESFMNLLSTHPSIQDRRKELEDNFN